MPRGFVYAVKVNRYLSHYLRLRVDRATVARSYDTVAGLGPTLAAMLVQLPPRMQFDRERLETYARAVSRRRRRHAIEPRDATWLTDDALAALRDVGFALCIIDVARWPTRIAVTADLVYLRFHGPEQLYASPYSDDQLRTWARRIRAWRDEGIDVLAYFNNDAMAWAPRDAARLRELVG